MNCENELPDDVRYYSLLIDSEVQLFSHKYVSCERQAKYPLKTHF